MTKIGFWQNVQSESKCGGLNNWCESYFYLDGISNKVGTRKYTVIAGSKVRLNDPKTVSFKKGLKTALKIASYATLLMPLVVLFMKVGFRCSRSFTIESELKIGTYNILFPQRKANENGSLPQFSSSMGYTKNGAGKVIPNTKTRTKIITKNLESAKLDIVCLQELDQNVRQTISETFSNYDNVYAKHKKSHGVAVFYDRTKFKLLNQKNLHGTFQTVSGVDPNVTIDNERSAVMVDLQDRTTKKIIRVVSGHFFDPNSFTDSKEQYHAWIVKETEEQPCIRIKGKKNYRIDTRIIAGDMNQDQYGDRSSNEYSGDRIAIPKGIKPSARNAAVFKPFLSQGYDVDDNLEPTEYWKDLNTNQIHSKGRKIDWIFVKGAKPEHHAIQGLNKGGSDHILVASSISI